MCVRFNLKYSWTQPAAGVKGGGKKEERSGGEWRRPLVAAEDDSSRKNESKCFIYTGSFCLSLFV